MNSLWPSRAPSDAMDGAKAPVDLADTGIAAETATVTPDPPTNPAPPRPVLQRNISAPNPNPPAQPPPPPGNQPPDSLSLAQLRRFVSEFPRSEALAYDFVYSDTGPHAEEIDEWFSYQFWQWVRLNAAQKAFDWHWDHEVGPFSGWDEVDDDVRTRFVRKALGEVSSRDDSVRNAAIGRVAYLILGRWCETVSTPPQGDRTKLLSVATPTQLSAIQAGIRLLAELDGLPLIWTALQNAMDALWQMEVTPIPSEGLQEKQDELMNLMTIMYMAAQETTNDRAGMASVRESLRSLDPDMATYMLSVLAKMRWLESPVLPMAHILLLLWKSLLVVFGGLDEVEETKKALRDADSEDKDKDTITASPLDYHVFRQEIASKYPAYVPPQLPLPLEADNTSLLPQLPNHPTRNNGSNGILPTPPNAQSGGASILHQPVHIATPAPSPPPSPSVGGKGGKKQNYQTNQNFPFMYPPLDATSNSAGGKGNACMQHSIVGRPWEGSDIPASILEAGELFSKRVRMTRATRQLWEERENFLKFERGWSPSEDDDLDSLDLDSLAREEGEEEIDEEKLLARIEKREAKTRKSEMNFGTTKDLDETTRRRLEAVEKLYNESLPQLQSVVIVLMKTFLYNITAYSTMQQAQANGMANFRMAQQPPNLFRSHDSANGLNGMAGPDNVDMSLEDLDATRAREIESKALTGILLLLLKWFKLSHVLKFEYLTQLLLDSNYIPLVLKLFVHQDVQQVVDSKTDRLDHSFFHFCNQRASPEGEEDEEEESEDEAAPPPIKRRKSPPEALVPAATNGEPGTQPEDEPPTRPEVDELGYPINPLPKEPITDFSRRNFFSLINYLRILQKICKKKAHRNLLLVQYKSSNIIRKSLKIPQPELRLYTLKLFKNQVPYCGRKWRQSNMRVITAVYLHCRPELRDEWLAGSDVDLEVEEALPLEQALRSLTHWFNVRHYPDRMWGGDVRDALQEEHDFFKRELEKLDVGWLDAGNPEMGGGEWDLHPGGWMPGWG